MVDNLQRRVVTSVLPTPTGANGGPVDFNATGDKFILTPSRPVDIYRFGITTIDAVDPDAGGFALALDFRPTAGSDSSRVEKDQLRRSDTQLVAAGTVVFRDVVIPVAQATGADGSLVNVGPAGPLHVRPGEEAVLEVTNAMGVASTGYVWIEYEEQGFAQPSTVSGNNGQRVTKDAT